MLKKTVFADNSPSSHYNPEVIAKEVHDYYGKSIRTVDARSIIASYYTHFRAVYNVQQQPTEVTYYRGTKAHRTEIQTVSAAGLDGKYFLLYSAPDNKKFAVWYNIDNGSTAPVVVDAENIEINIRAGDTASVVALATQLVLSNLYSDRFIASRIGTTVNVITVGLGLIDDTTDVDTGFTFTNTSGSQETVSSIEIDYLVNDPIYQGEVLKDYSFDIYNGKFVKNASLSFTNDSISIADEDGDKLEINVDGSLNVNDLIPTLVSEYGEVTGVANGVTTQIVEYIAPADSYLQKIELSGTNIAEFELTIDNVTIDKKRTYFGASLNSFFDFNKGLALVAGQSIKVLVVHNRPSLGDFNARVQVITA